MSNIRNRIIKDTIIFDDENNPSISKADIIWARSVLDAIFDQLDPNEKTLREILDDINRRIKEAGIGYIKFPVTSVNGMYDDVVISKNHIGLSRVNNTSDMEKPLSHIQRNEILTILANYNFNIDLSEIMSHLTDYNNPHRITIGQLDLDGSVTNLIKSELNLHDLNRTAHNDIRMSLASMSDVLLDNTTTLNQRMDSIIDNFNIHMIDNGAHSTLFDKKENTSNKVALFSKTNNYNDSKYPSSKAVVDFVEDFTRNFNSGSNIDSYISDIDIIYNDANLPAASELMYRKAFVIKNKNNSNYSAIAVCRKNGNEYWWDIKELNISKYDPKYFILTPEGLSLDVSVLPQVVDAFSKTESDQRYVQSVDIRPGTERGTIAYLLNNDANTLIDNIAIKGLSALAYRATVNGSLIDNNSINSVHISPKAIIADHINDGAITHEMLNGTIIDNSNIIHESIDNRTIKTRAITGDKIAYETITDGELAPESITADKILRNAVREIHIASGAVTGTKIANDSITSDKLAVASISNNKLVNMPAFSLKGNMGSAEATPSDVDLDILIDFILSEISVPQLQSLAAKLKPYM